MKRNEDGEMIFDGLHDKITFSKRKIIDALESHNNPVIGFTGGKDSTLVLWLVKEVCERNRYEKPTVMFIDHGQHFTEMIEYVNKITQEWGFDLRTVENTELTEYEPREEVRFIDLPREQQDELRDKFGVSRNGDGADEAVTIKNSLNSKEGNHMLKTFPMNQYIKENDVDAVINGIRWDEHDSRSDESFFSEREDPEHTRVHPILHITERDVWDITWFRIAPQECGWTNGYPSKGKTYEEMKKLDIAEGAVLPVAPKYFDGYRSLGSETQTQKTSNKPAWHQDLTEGTEREGRAQDKDEEDAMAELRDKGYMAIPLFTILASKLMGGTGVLV